MRRVKEVSITEEGRDKGKVFVITELPASQAEKWAARAFLSLARSGVEIPSNVAQAGLAGIAVLGLRALGGMNFFDAESLMDEMFSCVTIKPDLKNLTFTRALVEDDTEEVLTRVQLRMEVFELHTGFSLADAKLTLTHSMKASADSLSIQTSQRLSEL